MFVCVECRYCTQFLTKFISEFWWSFGTHSAYVRGKQENWDSGRLPEKALAHQCWPPLTHKHNRLIFIIRLESLEKTNKKTAARHGASAVNKRNEHTFQKVSIL